MKEIVKIKEHRLCRRCEEIMPPGTEAETWGSADGQQGYSQKWRHLKKCSLKPQPYEPNDGTDNAREMARYMHVSTMIQEWHSTMRED